MKREAYQIARDRATDAQRVPVTVSVPYELRGELADWIIDEVKKLESSAAMNLGSAHLRLRRGHAADCRSRASRMQARADLWRALYDQVVP